MLKSNEEIEMLAAEIERIRAKQPHIDSLLNAFGPLVVAKQRWLMEEREHARHLPIDAVQYLGGIPLSRQCQLLLPDDPWKSAGLAVASAISQGFPKFAGDMAGLSKRIAESSCDCFSLVNSSVAPDDADPTDKAQSHGSDQVALQFFLQFLTRFMLNKKAEDMAAELAALTWGKGYCPVCGSFPQLALIREQGQRWLQCGDCGHEWKFARLTCPCCEHEDPEDTTFTFVEGIKDDTAFTCSKCRRYLVTSNRSAELGQNSSDLIALSLVHLDLILQEKGFQPMAENDWNIFASGQAQADAS